MGFTKFYDSAVVGGAQEDKEEEAVIRHIILRTFCPSPYLLRSYIVYVTTPQVQLLNDE